MPVGLNLVEAVEEQLLATGLLPSDRSVLHRMIDFARGDFSLRWSSAETHGQTVSIRLVQQLAQRSVGKPIISWSVAIDEVEGATSEGQTLLPSLLRTEAVAAQVVAACEELIRAVSGPPEESLADPDPDVSAP